MTKKATSIDWSEYIRPGSRAFIGSNAACPQALVGNFLESYRNYRDVELIHILTLGKIPWADKKYHGHLKINSMFLGEGSREAVSQGVADYTPCFLSEIPRLFREGILPIDVALVSVSPADEFGFHSLGVAVDVVMAACESARYVIAQVNRKMPRTMGQSFIHKKEFSAVYEADEEIPEVHSVEIDEVNMKIGQYVAMLIEDGSTLQMGVGKIPDATLKHLIHHKDLGIHSELINDGILELYEKGVITNRFKKVHRGKSITSICVGIKKLYDFIHNNPHIELHPSDYTNNISVISQHDKMVAINSAMEVDLSGQVVSDSIGYRFYSGIGGQVDFLRGASQSLGGKPIIALPSTTKDHKFSKIVPYLTPGSGVVTSRGDVHYVVTEYGIATLRGRSIRERVLEMIQVAHPNFREKLLKEASEHYKIPFNEKLKPVTLSEFGSVEMLKLNLCEDEYIIRPLRRSDERRLQEFFYSHEGGVLLDRQQSSTMGSAREHAYELANANHGESPTLCIIQRQGPREVICAVGRYQLNEAKQIGEVSVFVSKYKRGIGMASEMIDKILMIGKKRKLKSMQAYVPMYSGSMRHVYEKFEFKIIKKDSNSEGQIMSLDL